MSNSEIEVRVVKYPDRKYLMMRYIDPITGKQIARSTRTTKRWEAERLAAKWEAELREGRYYDTTFNVNGKRRVVRGSSEATTRAS